jgi:hypothetical protein
MHGEIPAEVLTSLMTAMRAVRREGLAGLIADVRNSLILRVGMRSGMVSAARKTAKHHGR